MTIRQTPAHHNMPGTITREYALICLIRAEELAALIKAFGVTAAPARVRQAVLAMPRRARPDETVDMERADMELLMKERPAGVLGSAV